jgi:hypothetical protein
VETRAQIGHFALRAAELLSYGNFWRTRRACPNLLWILRSTSSKAGSGSQTHGVHSRERSPTHEPPFQTPPQCTCGRASGHQDWWVSRAGPPFFGAPPQGRDHGKEFPLRAGSRGAGHCDSAVVRRGRPPHGWVEQLGVTRSSAAVCRSHRFLRLGGTSGARVRACSP